jgi:hypothetical protein
MIRTTSLKMSKVLSKAENRRKNNTIANIKRSNNDLQNTTQKLKIDQYEPHKDRGEIWEGK